jgi:hypothetical protein
MTEFAVFDLAGMCAWVGEGHDVEDAARKCRAELSAEDESWDNFSAVSGRIYAIDADEKRALLRWMDRGSKPDEWPL